MTPAATVRTDLTRVLDLGSEPGDDRDLRVRKRTAVAAALVLMSVAVVIGGTDVAAADPISAGLAAVQLAVFGTALLVFHRTHRLAPLIVTMAIAGMTVLLLSLIPTGGLTSSAVSLIWIILVPLVAVLFLGSRAGVPALAGLILVVAIAVVMDPYLPAARQDPSLARLLITAIDLIVPAALALGLVVFIDGERMRAKAESDALLLNVLPRSIADRLKGGERVIADHYDDVTILFADVVDFTPFAARETPAHVVAVLNEVFSRFDTLAERYGLEKIKTIGDAYMVVAGAPDPREDHASVILEMAIAMHREVGSIERMAGHPLRLRVGIATGAAVAGVIGRRKFSYDLWGDAVNVASRMESTGIPGMIQVAEPTWQLCGGRYSFTPREVDVKGLGTLRTYVLDPASVAPRTV